MCSALVSQQLVEVASSCRVLVQHHISLNSGENAF